MDTSIKCRLCLKIKTESLNIFNEKSKDSIAPIIKQHFGIEVMVNDCISTYICTDCWSQTENFHKFYNLVHAVQDEYIKDTVLKVHDVKLVSTTVKTVDTAVENEPSSNETSSTVKRHAPETESSGESYNVMSRKQLKKAKQNDPTEIENQNQIIREYMKMECELCSIVLDSFQDIKSHFRNDHNTRGYLRCCNRKYTQRPMLVQHIQRHINPDAFKCELCDKIYHYKQSLDEHMARHVKLEKPHKCFQCSKSFTNKFLLNRHSQIHKNETFTCDECGNAFATRSLLQGHKKRLHEGSQFVCDICAKIYRSKVGLVAHCNRVHEQINLPRAQCEICGSWLKNCFYLKKHMNRHKEETIFCDICGSQSRNRNALNSHKRTVHSNKLYSCILCEKTFKKPLSLKEHMAVHTGNILYRCPYCPKTFNTSGNIYMHKKKHHPAELAEHEKLKAIGAI